ncbi:5-formyltetrahydrofolate cyclo-ligase [Pyrobaculum aerophilum]|uniref:5-formyltetrahydrofolate cyclo-ligase n=1 Tax=Pyrobaculum aerophilum TaxID=13773 RepID=A0A371R009_9CREN|nr:5-formyltetrahydrofolate cyclo-ligase [Pyrobaculum aerophilum]RFA96338.1 5-formyltetrahydrofolate cyclo-ligase [Pyrobaculum aerophilum]RFA96626.1 5-formyltetrahydrofolate cyclo-ligase [Pyrobaculum aerophilum]
MAKEAKMAIRERIWRLMEEMNIAAFPRPVHGRIPNFKGADRACANILHLIQRAEVVKINPDAPQRPCREASLRAGKKVVMPTPRIREGFLLLDPLLIPREAYGEASTISGAFKWGRPVKPWELPKIDLVIIGSVAVNPKNGRRLGKSHGYAEIEWGILSTFDKVGEDTPVATTVHDVQLVEEDIPKEPFDLPVDFIATPTRLIAVKRVDKKPRGIFWEHVTEEMLAEIPLLAEIRKSRI